MMDFTPSQRQALGSRLKRLVASPPRIPSVPPGPVPVTVSTPSAGPERRPQVKLPNLPSRLPIRQLSSSTASRVPVRELVSNSLPKPAAEALASRVAGYRPLANASPSVARQPPVDAKIARSAGISRPSISGSPSKRLTFQKPSLPNRENVEQLDRLSGALDLLTNVLRGMQQPMSEPSPAPQQLPWPTFE